MLPGLLALLKVAYKQLDLLLLILVLILDKRIISNKHRWLLFAGTTTIGVIIYAIWSANWSSLNSIVDTGTQSNLIVHNLPKFATGIIVNVLYAPFLILKINELGYLLVYGALIFILSRNIRDKQVVVPNKVIDILIYYKIQIIGVLVWAASLAMTYAALLLTWTDISKYGWFGIQGFQERYLLPLLPLLILIYYLPQSSVLPPGKKEKIPAKTS